MAQLNKFVQKHLDTILTVVLLGIFILWATVQFDYYYELNDDVLIKKILSGEYTGEPEGRNIQMLWPLSQLLHIPYHCFPNVPWYGLFLCGMQYLCAGLLIHRSLGYAKTKRAKLLLGGIILGLFLVLFLEHLVFVHYSITAALMVATAAYLFYSLPLGLSTKAFWRGSIWSIVFIFLACCLRPNMLLLLLPLVGVTGFIRWSREDKPLEKQNLIRYLGVIGGILVVVGGCFWADHMAYSSPEWSRFETLFANRTQLYDFQVIPDYDSHWEFYEEIGLQESQQKLLVNYNYGLDQSITEETIGQVADYAKQMKDARMKERVRTAVWEYSHRLFKQEDSPWNAIVLLLYVILFVSILMRKDGKLSHNLGLAVWRLGLLFFVRTVLWMYILVNGRCPVRISHSLYLMELCILFALLLVEYTRKLREKNFMILLTGCILFVTIILLIPYRIRSVKEQVNRQEAVNRYGIAIEDYCKERANQFYYLDVYSTIIEGYSFAESMFGQVDHAYENHDLLGGWSCNSPLYRKKQECMGLRGSFEDLISEEGTNCFLIHKLSEDTSWIVAYYQAKGYAIALEEMDQIADFYGVYRLEVIQDAGKQDL